MSAAWLASTHFLQCSVTDHVSVAFEHGVLNFRHVHIIITIVLGHEVAPKINLYRESGSMQTTKILSSSRFMICLP